MLSERDSCDCYKAHVDSEWKIFKANVLHFLRLNINSLLPKIDEIVFFSKRSNTSIIGNSKSKVASSILISELKIEDCDLIRLDHWKRDSGVACYIRKS